MAEEYDDSKGDDDKLAYDVGDEDEDKSESDFSDSEDDLGDSDTGLTENQNRLLYFLSLFTHAAQSEDEKEEWIRQQALMVLIYEGVVAQVLDYDYAPASCLVEGRRKYFNVSQEGKSDVDFLREEELVNGLKLSSKEYQPVTCYQISEKGLEVVKKLSKADKEAVHELAYAPGTRDLMRVEWDGEEYWLKTQTFTRKSTVTETEDVSYVSSAYVPQCLRHGGRPTLSNAHRAHECNTSDSNIRDELDEVITLNSVSIIVAEYVPCGANQIVQLNENLGSTERVQGGFFTALIDEDASGTKFEVPPGLTSVNILDYTLTNHINFEADIHFPEEEGIVQVETFGVSINADGTIFYGMQIEAVMDRIKDNISLDHLSRLLVDVQQDSSKIVDSVISLYQRSLLHLIFSGDAENRDKVNLIIANEITPHLTAEEYMDKGEYENELKQVLGDTRAAFDISEHDTLIFGAHGILVAGPNSRHHEPLLCSYLQFISLDIFVRNFFNRMFITVDSQKQVREKIENHFNNPNNLSEIRDEMAVLSSEQIMLEEILGYLEESLATMLIPPEPPEQSGRSLYERLQIADMKAQLLRRVKDLVKNLSGSRHELDVLQEMAQIVSEKKSIRTQGSIDTSLKDLIALQDASARASASLEIVNTILAGSLAFDLLDRLTGEWTVVNTSWMRDFVEPMIRNTPMVWLIVNLVVWVLVAMLIKRLLKRQAFKAQGVITLRIFYQRPINIEQLNAYVSARHNKMIFENRDYESTNDIVKLKWYEKDKRDWGGVAPEIEVEYDEKYSFMLRMTIVYEKRLAKKNLAFNSQELKTRLFQDFKAANIFLEDEEEDEDKAGEVDFG